MCIRDSSIDTELRARMTSLEKAAAGVEVHRGTILRSYSERLQSRMQELLGAQVEKERIMQEVAVLVDRSDIQEELVRLKAHVKHFFGLLDQGGEVGKKLDFLLQEMNREANTLLSKTSGLAGEALKLSLIHISKGAFDFRELAASLKRCPDTRLEFFSKL